MSRASSTAKALQVRTRTCAVARLHRMRNRQIPAFQWHDGVRLLCRRPVVPALAANMHAVATSSGRTCKSRGGRHDVKLLSGRPRITQQHQTGSASRTRRAISPPHISLANGSRWKAASSMIGYAAYVTCDYSKQWESTLAGSHNNRVCTTFTTCTRSSASQRKDDDE